MLPDYIPIEEQDEFFLRKDLLKEKFEFHIGRIGLFDNPFLAEREC